MACKVAVGAAAFVGGGVIFSSGVAIALAPPPTGTRVAGLFIAADLLKTLPLTGDFFDLTAETGDDTGGTATSGLGTSFLDFVTGAGATGLATTGFIDTVSLFASFLSLAGSSLAAANAFVASSMAVLDLSEANFGAGRGANGIEAAGFSVPDFCATLPVVLSLTGSALAAVAEGGGAAGAWAGKVTVGLDVPDLAAANGFISLALSGSTLDTVATAAITAAFALGTFFAAFVGTDLTGLAVGAGSISAFAGALGGGAGIFAGLTRATAFFVSLTAGPDFVFGRV